MVLTGVISFPLLSPMLLLYGNHNIRVITQIKYIVYMSKICCKAQQGCLKKNGGLLYAKYVWFRVRISLNLYLLFSLLSWK